MTSAVHSELVRHRVVVLCLPGVLPLELGIAAQIFSMNPKYELVVATQGRVEPTAHQTFALTGTEGLDALERADTVFVPGYEDLDAAISNKVLTAVRAAHERGSRMVSICSGAFVLAAAGLLDGRPATTHWQVADRLRKLYPLIDVQPDRIFVDDGDVLTSAGVTAGIDLCLHLIRIDHGAAAANTAARGLVAPPRRAGDQAQYVERLRSQPTGHELAGVREWMLDNLAEPITIDVLAARVHMSRRTLIRRFRDDTGTSAMAWLNDARIDRARELLETTTEPVERIGRLTGLGNPASVRAAFHRRVGTSPQEYRSLFRQKVTY
ncbi:transcriptional regulator GlxA family with amidase domain [Kribbella orskensis]|uniref:Transcriptional regulator GlxA family with amidase domain n=1 Tax=Kribbella orskensis TaxID=2512216 RepID=A0ABY2BD87_9ACTN|nr:MULTISPECIES: helix-turn-helix domain-containing protein [Kribbella]TCN35479.1 transcriptional regulator GlxA family with amidase domain [Kribbella sp. VKM Ac-2500]TCO17021.1 transcriptional regulator GlxA family with amidase domain [Kribbella orskensis]